MSTAPPVATSVATPLLDGLTAFLRDDGWPVAVTATEPVPTLETRCASATREWTCVGRTFEPQGQVVFDSQLPLTVPQPLLGEVGLLLLRANWSLHTGSFSLDPATGAVRLRSSLVVTADTPLLPPPAAKALVYANVLIVDRCLEPLLDAAAGNLSGNDAFNLFGLA